MAEEPISLDIFSYVSRLIAWSMWVTEVKNPLRAPGNEYEIFNEIPKLKERKSIESIRQ
jgi:hypothetical protein